MNRNKIMIIMVTLISVLWVLGLFFGLKKSTECDERVTLNDGTIIDCTHAWNDEMMTHLNTCDGERMEVPTTSIKYIKEIKNAN